jgi:hypothetical protein
MHFDIKKHLDMDIYRQGIQSQVENTANEGIGRMLKVWYLVRDHCKKVVAQKLDSMVECLEECNNLVKGSINYREAYEFLIRTALDFEAREIRALNLDLAETDFAPVPRGADVELLMEECRDDGDGEIGNQCTNLGQSCHNVDSVASNDAASNGGGQNQPPQNPPTGNEQPPDQNERRDEERRNPRRNRNRAHPFASGWLFGCFLTVSGRANIAFTVSEYERLTRNGYNLVNTYPTFDQG